MNWFDKSPYYSGDIENEGGYIYKDENGNLVTGYENSGAVRQNLATGVYQSLKPDAKTYCPTLNFSAAEIEELGEIRNNLKTFVNQQRTLYVLGQEASFLDDKDAFLAELNNIGLERFLELADVAYQRQYVDYSRPDQSLWGPPCAAPFSQIPAGGTQRRFFRWPFLK